MREWISIWLLCAHVREYFFRMSVMKCREMKLSVFAVFARSCWTRPKEKEYQYSCRVEYVKNKKLLVAPGQQSVVLAAEVEKLGHCLHRVENYSQLSCISCARQVVRLVYSCSTITSRCNEPLKKLEDSPECLTPPTCVQTIFSASMFRKRTWQAYTDSYVRDIWTFAVLFLAFRTFVASDLFIYLLGYHFLFHMKTLLFENRTVTLSGGNYRGQSVCIS